METYFLNYGKRGTWPLLFDEFVWQKMTPADSSPLSVEAGIEIGIIYRLL